MWSRRETLLNYFPENFLLFIDESHVTIPQIGGMYRGDRSRKETLVEFGFRLPSALDNRPLNFEEFESFLNQTIYVSATPAQYEIEKSNRVVVEQVIRPTGLMDPEVRIQPARSQVDDLLEEIRKRTGENELLEAQRVEQRTRYDLELLAEMGFCPGIENYSRHLTGRRPGEPPPTLLNYFPENFLLFIDESHVTIPQIGGMYRGDRSRKETLVEFGFRLPSALDNRPLNFEEFESFLNQTIYVSATPAQYEIEKSNRVVVEQVIRPTGLMDPEVRIQPARSQVDDLLEEIRKRTGENERVLVTTLTKRMAEDLTDYYQDLNVRVRYLHSDIETLERVNIIRDLRKGAFDVLVGINLLREGLDLPEVSLVAVLDADKEGFLRSERSLIQTMGRAARNVNGTVILFADIMTQSMKRAIDETNRRRRLQSAFNKKNRITPQTIVKSLGTPLVQVYEADYVTVPMALEGEEEYLTLNKIPRRIEHLKKEMKQAAANLEFEKAAELRDQIRNLQEREIGLRDPLSARGSERIP